MKNLESEAKDFNLRQLTHRVRALAFAIVTLVLFAGTMRAQSAADGFNPNVNGSVFAVAMRSSGKIVIGGIFTSVNGVARSNLAQLNPDGTLDTSFTVGTDGGVNALLIQPDGKVVVGGVFTTLGGQPRNNLGRIAGNATDANFNPSPNSFVSALAQQADNKILVGGFFTIMDGLSAQRIARLNTDGSLDQSFVTTVNNGSVVSLAIETDGQILFGGSFTSVNGQTRNRMARAGHGGGLDQNFNPNVSGNVTAIAVQPGGRIVFGGSFTSVNGQTRNRLARLNDDGSLDAGFNPNVNNVVSALALQPDGDFLAGGDFTTVGGQARNRLARFKFDGTLDTGFAALINDQVNAIAVQADRSVVIGGGFTAINLLTHNRLARLLPEKGLPDSDLTIAADDVVQSMAAQPDGKLLIGGQFTTVGGQARNHIARLNADGSLDSGFNPNANGAVYSIAVLPDGKILVGGVFATIAGGIHPGFVRLNSDGSFDASFTGGANAEIFAIAVQPDGKIVVGGNFTSIAGGARNRIARLNANGTLDAGFNPNANDTIWTLALETDGQIVLGGSFTNLGGVTRNHIARLNSNGSLDNTFNPGADSAIYALLVHADGKLLCGGAFTTLAGGARSRIGRLNTDGSLDNSFNPGANSSVYALAEQMNGKLLMGGAFTQFGGLTRNRIARISYNGTMDAQFDAGITGVSVSGMLVLPDGKIVVGGNFTQIGGLTRNCLGRLNTNELAWQSLKVNDNGTDISWQFVGSAPNFNQVMFEFSTDGVNYSSLAAPTRVGGGWLLTGQSLQPVVNYFIRARGIYTGGTFSGSKSVTEAVFAGYNLPCGFNVSPTANTHGPGGGTFFVEVVGINQSCNWTAQSNVGWMTVSGTGPGSQYVSYSLTSNPGITRIGTLTVAGTTVTITQTGATCEVIVVNPVTIPNATLNTPYTQTFTQFGAVLPVTMTLVGTLPTGLSYNQATATLSGTPTQTGNFNFTVTATSSNGCQGVRNYNLAVNPASGVSATNLQFYPLAHPVRLLDTRVGFTGCDSPAAKIAGGTSRTQTAAGRTCDGLAIPANAAALVGNATSVQSGGGYFTLYPSDIAKPNSANSNYSANQILNSLFTVRLGANDGAFKIFVSTDTDIVVDITGYYAPPSQTGLYYHPLPHPVRLLDTRAGATACYTPGQPIQGNTERTQLGTTTCDNVLIPGGALALTGNATTVSPQANGFLTLYPADAARPLIASANFQPGVNLNSPFMVGLSPSGEFNIYVASTTDLVVDVTGYYSTQLNDSNGQGLLFNALTGPTRLLDTRAGMTGCYTPGVPMAGGTSYTQPATGACSNIPAAAQAVVGNATTVNEVANGYLTFWPSDANQPFIATSNFRTGIIFNRHFTAGLGADGAFKRYAASTTDLVVDLVGYFAP